MCVCVCVCVCVCDLAVAGDPAASHNNVVLIHQGSSPWTGGLTLDSEGNTGITVTEDGCAEVWDLRRNQRLQKLR